MTETSLFRTALLVGVLAFSAPASAFHQSAPPVTEVTLGGDTDLPRIPPQGRRAMVLDMPSGLNFQVSSYLPFTHGAEATIIASTGDNERPAVSFNGRGITWDTDADPLGSGAPGRQVISSYNGVLAQVAVDPTGTSTNASLDKRGATVVFQSKGDLAGTGPGTKTRIFYRDRIGTITQVSSGLGESRKPMLSAKKGWVAYESTSDPVSGVDTGVFQIYAGRVTNLPAERITAGAVDSTDVIISDDARLLTWASRADLAGDGHDTGASQIFLYDTRTLTYAQVTDDPGGCSRPGVAKIRRDWRIAFTCGGQAYFYMLREDQRFHVQIPDGSVQTIVPEMGVHFVLLSTNANMLGTGTTAGNQIYLVNLFKRPAEPVPGLATWFPFRGIAGF